MRKVAVEQAVGLALGHDITEIDPVRRLKRRAFRRGQVITAADVERLRDSLAAFDRSVRAIPCAWGMEAFDPMRYRVAIEGSVLRLSGCTRAPKVEPMTIPRGPT